MEAVSGVARKTLADFEGGKKQRPQDRTLLDIRRALEEAGVILVAPNGDGPGVRLKRVIWRLAPINHESPNWKASVYKEDVIIRAATEDRARQIASRAFWIGVNRVSGALIANPWGRPINETTCERATDTNYSEEGPDEILSPAEYDDTWAR